jgi:DNA helicase II / ATP-dependent DNA helicase PcrA
VSRAHGPLLVFAGAGSGKTRVITYRIANLVAREHVAPYRILAVTFTNKAAGELRARLGAMLGDEFARDLWVGTFHATCAKLLRRLGEPVGLSKSFVIYDSSDQKSVITRVLRELKYDEKRYAPKQVLSRIHSEKQEGRGPEEMSRDSYMDDAIYKAYVGYERALLAANAVDFEDLILRTVRLLQGTSAEAHTLRTKFSHVLVDEFQDTNATQYAFLRELTREHQNLCVVGDDDQSIYAWRGADVRNIRGFQTDYPGAHVVKLEQNYRSTGAIVEAALGVIAPSRQRVPKALWTDNPAGNPVRIVAVQDEREEAAFVLKSLQRARSEGVALSQIAVFYRVHAQSRVLEEALRSANLAYQIIGGMKFYERAEVKDALAYLRILSNPQSDVDLLRIINVPARGIGGTTVERLTVLATKTGESIYAVITRGVSDAQAVDDDGKPLFAAAARKRLEQFGMLLVGLRREATGLKPPELLERVLAASGYRAHLELEDSAEADARLENIAELRGSLQDYSDEAEARGEEPSLEGFLERVTLQADDGNAEVTERATLMTVHGAKGLEFELVLLTGMEEDMFPYRGMQDRDSFDPDHVDEERRLAYVAITRARQNLVIIHTRARQIFGNTRYGTPSRFLADIPPDVCIQERAGSLALTSSAPRAGASHMAPRAAGPWVHPATRNSDDDPSFAQRPALPSRPPLSVPVDAATNGTFVDREYFDDTAEEAFAAGSRVHHARFGEGRVQKLLSLGEPAVLAFFPGWGEMKVLARFLRAI